jgi:hypothetical protein
VPTAREQAVETRARERRRALTEELAAARREAYRVKALAEIKWAEAQAYAAARQREDDLIRRLTDLGM